MNTGNNVVKGRGAGAGWRGQWEGMGSSITLPMIKNLKKKHFIEKI